MEGGKKYRLADVAVEGGTKYRVLCENEKQEKVKTKDVPHKDSNSSRKAGGKKGTKLCHSWMTFCIFMAT